MNLDELQSVQARERQSSDLQHLRSSFYREVGEYIQSLTEKRAAVVEGAEDPFSSPEVRQLTDDIETAEQTVEAIYERRVGKVVKKASIAAAGMPVDDEGLTHEEEVLFDDLVSRIESNRETVLSVLDGDVPTVSCSIDDTAETSVEPDSGPSVEARAESAEPTSGQTPPESESVSAADLMGSDPGTESAAGSAAEPSREAPGSEQSAGRSVEDAGGERAAGDGELPDNPGFDPLAAEPTDGASNTADASPEPGPESPGRPASGESASVGSDRTGGAEPATAETIPEGEASASGPDRDVVGVPRTTVRITADIGEMVGADDRDYNLASEDVVTLPEPNADVLIEKDAAERVE